MTEDEETIRATWTIAKRGWVVKYWLKKQGHARIIAAGYNSWPKGKSTLPKVTFTSETEGIFGSMNETKVLVSEAPSDE